jgi:hypothetical protein
MFPLLSQFLSHLKLFSGHQLLTLSSVYFYEYMDFLKVKVVQGAVVHFGSVCRYRMRANVFLLTYEYCVNTDKCILLLLTKFR